MVELYSTVNYPITIKYNNELMVISPYEKVKNVDKSKLSMPLPKGVILKEKRDK